LVLTSLVSSYAAKPNIETVAIGRECVIAVDTYIYAYPLVIAEPTVPR
jgi:hypothetical protein